MWKSETMRVKICMFWGSVRRLTCITEHLNYITDYNCVPGIRFIEIYNCWKVKMKLETTNSRPFLRVRMDFESRKMIKDVFTHEYVWTSEGRNYCRMKLCTIMCLNFPYLMLSFGQNLIIFMECTLYRIWSYFLETLENKCEGGVCVNCRTEKGSKRLFIA